MTENTHSILKREGQPDLAYIFSEGAPDQPVVVFLGGYASDMGGTKATWLEAQCQARGQGYLRLDYSGHGQSGGDFKDGTIGIWKEDAKAVIAAMCGAETPLILVGSSMGGWIGLLLLLELGAQVQGFVGIAAAPDFTREVEDRLSAEQKADLATKGYAEQPNEYSETPYIFTRSLLDDGETRCLLDGQYETPASMILLQGKLDEDVPWQKAERIAEIFTAPSTDVRLIDDGDHRLSRPEDLAKINQAVLDLR